MEISFIIVIIVAIVWLTFISRPRFVKDDCNNQTAEQNRVIRYFMKDSCIRPIISDIEYDEMIVKRMKSLNSKENAIIALGLEESDILEMEPIQFDGFLYDRDKTLGKRGLDGLMRSSAYQISWFFFTSTQVCFYQYTFHMDRDESYEKIDKYLYEDSTILFTEFDMVETSMWSRKRKMLVSKKVNCARFCMIVPGDVSFGCMELYDYTERAIQMIRRKFREKNSA